MTHDIRATIGPILDRALDAVSHPDDRIFWDFTTSLAAGEGGGAPVVQFVVALMTPSPIIGNTITSMKAVDPIRLVQGDTALDLARELVENVRSMRAKVLAIQK